MNRLRPKGEDVATAIRDWMKEEIKLSPSRVYELGRFLFGVTVGTIGVFLTIEKLGAPGTFNRSLKISLVSLFCSGLVALDMARPKHWKLDGDVDLFSEYKRLIDNAKIRNVAWVLLWLSGTVFGIYGTIA